MGVGIKAKFGKDTKSLNGLEAILEELLDKPLETHYVIAKVRTAYTKTDYINGGEEVPTVAFEHIEVMLSDKEVKDAKRLFEAAAKARLGELPQQTLFDAGKPDAGEGEGGEPQ